MRGNLIREYLPAIQQRSIPAYAGEPWVALLIDADEPVYPRVCGGTGYEKSQQAGKTGLSPRMRGNPLC